MTKLSKRKSRFRAQTEDTVFSQGGVREVCIETFPKYLVVWLKGTCKEFAVPYSAIYFDAALKEASMEKQAKARKRAEKR